MEGTPIQVTSKDPKKVEAGKRLAEYNRKQRERLKELESADLNSLPEKKKIFLLKIIFPIDFYTNSVTLLGNCVNVVSQVSL